MALSMKSAHRTLIGHYQEMLKNTSNTDATNGSSDDENTCGLWNPCGDSLILTTLVLSSEQQKAKVKEGALKLSQSNPC